MTNPDAFWEEIQRAQERLRPDPDGAYVLICHSTVLKQLSSVQAFSDAANAADLIARFNGVQVEVDDILPEDMLLIVLHKHAQTFEALKRQGLSARAAAFQLNQQGVESGQSPVFGRLASAHAPVTQYVNEPPPRNRAERRATKHAHRR